MHFSSLFLQIVLSVAEHHSAIVPWQFVAQKTGAVLKFVELTAEEVPDIKQLKGLISNKTKIVVVHHVSNALGRYIYTNGVFFIFSFSLHRALTK